MENVLCYLFLFEERDYASDTIFPIYTRVHPQQKEIR